MIPEHAICVAVGVVWRAIGNVGVGLAAVVGCDHCWSCFCLLVGLPWCWRFGFDTLPCVRKL